MRSDARDQPSTAAQRKAEIVGLLAKAYARLLVRRKGLDLRRDSEPSCAPVDAQERRGIHAPMADKEVA